VLDTVTRVSDTSLGRLTGIAAAITWDSIDTTAVNLNFGTGTSTVNVQGTGVTTNLFNLAAATVNVGSANSIAGIQGTLNINNLPSYDQVNLLDGADAAAHPAVAIAAGGVTGLAPAPINFSTSPNCVNSLNVTGGGGNNTYTITGSQAFLGTTLNAGGGTDVVNLQGNAYPVAIITAGGSGADAINLGDAANTLNGITGAVTVNAAGTDALNVNDQGTAAARTYTVTGTSVAWSGGPAVTYAGLGAVSLGGGGGNDTYLLSGTSTTAALTATGGSGTNTVVGSNAGNVWSLAGSNAGSLSGPAYPSPAAFANMPNLTAGSGGDYFAFADGASVSGNLTGGGTDTLDYSAYTTSVTVDLQPAIASATGVGGLVSGITTVLGGSGAPGTPGLYNLLIGSNVGGDTLQGGTGRRNLLVAGGNPSTLGGGDGEDLLVGGTTTYDTQAGLANWGLLAAYWAGADPFATRVTNVEGGLGVPLLDASTVTGNFGGNTFNGGGGTALIYTDNADNIVPGTFASTTLYTIAP
jgi:hypothetical protein